MSISSLIGLEKYVDQWESLLHLPGHDDREGVLLDRGQAGVTAPATGASFSITVTQGCIKCEKELTLGPLLKNRKTKKGCVSIIRSFNDK